MLICFSFLLQPLSGPPVSSVVPSSHGVIGGSDAVTVGLMLPPRSAPTPMMHRGTQSDITLKHVEELESRASMDMEAKNSRIDSLQCVSIL